MVKKVRALVKIVLGFSFFFTTLSKICEVFFVFFDYLCNIKIKVLHMIYSKFYPVEMSDFESQFGLFGFYSICYRYGVLVDVQSCAADARSAELECRNYCLRPDVVCVSFFLNSGVMVASACVVNQLCCNCIWGSS